MPPINQAALASVGIIAASVAVAAAIAIYESPEVRRVADDLRRRIAIAFHSLGDNVDPGRREPRFNRPEDAEGFYQSHDIDADEETRRRQREELMYWNARREEQQRQQQPQRETQEQQTRSRGSSFDDFLQPDKEAGHGTYVYNSGANVWNSESSNVLRHRGNTEGVRGLNAAVLSNPFSDEYGIELGEQPRLPEFEHPAPVPPAREEVMSDIYNATPRILSPQNHSPPAPIAVPIPVPVPEVLFDFETHSQPDAHSDYATAVGQASQYHQPEPQPQSEQPGTSTPTTSRSSVTLDHGELAEDEYMTAGQDRTYDNEAYASIQAWAQGSSANHNAGFYSPIPVSSPAQSTASFPPPPVSEPSEPEMISEGQLTPTDSVSVVGSEAVDVAHFEHEDEEDAGVLSESEAGMATPTGSWSEVGSVVSESDSEGERDREREWGMHHA